MRAKHIRVSPLRVVDWSPKIARYHGEAHTRNKVVAGRIVAASRPQCVNNKCVLNGGTESHWGG